MAVRTRSAGSAVAIARVSTVRTARPHRTQAPAGFHPGGDVSAHASPREHNYADLSNQALVLLGKTLSRSFKLLSPPRPPVAELGGPRLAFQDPTNSSSKSHCRPFL